MTHDPAADIIDVIITSPCQEKPFRTVTTAEKMGRSDNQHARFFAMSTEKESLEYEDRGTTVRFERRKK